MVNKAYLEKQNLYINYVIVIKKFRNEYFSLDIYGTYE